MRFVRPWLSLSVLLVAGAALAQDESDLGEISVQAGSARVVTLRRLEKAVVGNPDVADVRAVPPNRLVIRGRRPGKTTLMAWAAGGRRVSYVIDVRHAPAASQEPGGR